MATDTVLMKRTMLAAFMQKARPTGFLSSFFRTTDRDIVQSKKVVMDIKRTNEEYAVDVVRSSGGNFNKNKEFNTKEYVPPFFDEYLGYTADELFDRLPGMTEYDNTAYASQLLALITDDQILLQNKINRAIEKMAAETILDGKVTLVNGDSLDFKQKATHHFGAATVWSTGGTDPAVDLNKACTLCRKDGQVMSGIFNAIFSETSWKEFLALISAANYKGRLDVFGIDDIQSPVMNTEGAVFHGVFTAGSFKIQCWTYPQYYTVPTGFGLSNEGTLQPYITDEHVIVMPDAATIDLRMVYAGIPVISPTIDPRIQSLGLPGMPTSQRGKWLPYYRLDDKNASLILGLRSAPLPIPVQIDGFAVIES